MPEALGRVHPRYLTPHVSTIVIGVLATVWYVPLNLISENFLFDTLSALSLMIAFYYALSGFACVIYYRRELTKSVTNFLFIGVAPFVGAALLAFLFVRSVLDLADPDASYSGGSFLGLGMPLVIGGGFLLLGAVLMVLWRIGDPRGFFERRPSRRSDPEIVAAGRRRAADGPVSDDADRRLRRLAGARRALDVALELATLARRPAGRRLRRAAARPPVGEEYRAHQAILEEQGRGRRRGVAGRPRRA